MASYSSLGSKILALFFACATYAPASNSSSIASHIERSNAIYDLASNAFVGAFEGNGQLLMNAEADAGWCGYHTIKEKLAEKTTEMIMVALTDRAHEILNEPRAFSEAMTVVRSLTVGFSVGRASGLEMLKSQWKGESDFKVTYCHLLTVRAEKLLGNAH